MINVLKSKMSENDYSSFISDYHRLYCYKSDKKLWKEAMRSKKGYVPLLKNMFDELGNPYHYNSFTQKVRGNSSLYYIICGLNKPIKNSETIKDCLLLHYQTEIYIGFIVEWILFEQLKESRVRVYKNNILDMKKKADLLLNGHFYQIKNYSFLSSERLLENLINYKRANNELFFIFYVIEKENINFLLIKEKPCIHINKIDGFTFNEPKRITSLNEFLSFLLVV